MDKPAWTKHPTATRWSITLGDYVLTIARSTFGKWRIVNHPYSGGGPSIILACEDNIEAAQESALAAVISIAKERISDAWELLACIDEVPRG